MTPNPPPSCSSIARSRPGTGTRSCFSAWGTSTKCSSTTPSLGARVLGITLTARGDGVPLAGVPVKAAADYLRQLVAAGHRVAVCEQVEDPRKAKGIVKRAVVETITPGAVLDDTWLNGSRNNFIVATEGRTDGPADSIGLAAIDLSTGEFLLETVSGSGLAEALGRLNPAELVVSSEGADLPGPRDTSHSARALGVRSRAGPRRARAPLSARLPRWPGHREPPTRPRWARQGHSSAISPISSRAVFRSCSDPWCGARTGSCGWTR